jgi:hypothetical protein
MHSSALKSPLIIEYINIDFNVILIKNMMVL